WYRDFINWLLSINAEPWFAWLIVFGELAVALGLIFGILTGFAAFFGALMNMSFLLAGSASTNPVLFTMAIGLILGWKVAGWIGLDRYLLPFVGVPWRAEVSTGRTSEPSDTAAAAT
ncbi:MAG TPA: DoxX family membrane protein, partial [Candidatus Limnocylindrales bacterium]